MSVLLERRTTQRQPLDRKRREGFVLVLQDYRGYNSTQQYQQLRFYHAIWGIWGYLLGRRSGPWYGQRTTCSRSKRRRKTSGSRQRAWPASTRHIQAYVDAGKFPGAISMVQRRGKVVHFQTYGRRDVEAGTPVERRHDLPHLLHDQAHRQRRSHDAVRRGALAA